MRQLRNKKRGESIAPSFLLDLAARSAPGSSATASATAPKEPLESSRECAGSSACNAVSSVYSASNDACHNLAFACWFQLRKRCLSQMQRRQWTNRLDRRKCDQSQLETRECYSTNHVVMPLSHLIEKFVGLVCRSVATYYPEAAPPVEEPRRPLPKIRSNPARKAGEFTLAGPRRDAICLTPC